MTSKLGTEEMEQNSALLESVAAAMVGNKTTSMASPQQDDTHDVDAAVVDASGTNNVGATVGIMGGATDTEKMDVGFKQQQGHSALSTPMETNPTEIVHAEFTQVVQQLPQPHPPVVAQQEATTAHDPHPSPANEVTVPQVNTPLAMNNDIVQPPTQENKMDMVLNKLDEILARLDRIEAMAAAGGNIGGAKPTVRGGVKPKLKNGPSAMVKSILGSSIQEINLHFYDNEYHVLPQGWILPKLNFEGLMQFWYLGDPSSGVPPLIKVGGTEFKNLPRGVRKRSDMKYLMKHVERKGKEIGCFIEDINDWSLEAIRNLFNQIRSYFEYPNKSSTQTKFEKLSWETVCHNLRRNKGVLVGEDPQQVQSEEMDHPIPIPEPDPNVQHTSMIPVHVSNENPISEAEQPSDVVMEEATADAADAEKEPSKSMLI